jgi:hypothetical protein
MRFFMKKGNKKQHYESVTAMTSLCYEHNAEIQVNLLVGEGRD